MTLFYVRLSSKTATAGGLETELLTGTCGTDYTGSESFGIANAGQVFKLHAWGTWANPDNANGMGQIRLYFTPALGATILIADTTANIQPIAGGPSGDGNPNEWHFFAEITIRKMGNLTNGRGMVRQFVRECPGLARVQSDGRQGQFRSRHGADLYRGVNRDCHQSWQHDA